MEIESAGVSPLSVSEAPTEAGTFHGRTPNAGANPSAAPVTLAELLDECDLPATHLAAAQAPEVQARYEAQTQSAIDAGVFGAPTYVIEGELFWGQDRLDFVRRALGL